MASLLISSKQARLPLQFSVDDQYLNSPRVLLSLMSSVLWQSVGSAHRRSPSGGLPGTQRRGEAAAPRGTQVGAWRGREAPRAALRPHGAAVRSSLPSVLLFKKLLRSSLLACSVATAS